MREYIQKICSLGSMFCALLALGLIIWGLGNRIDRDPTPPRGGMLTLDEPLKELGSAPAKSKVQATIRLTNHSSRPVRVVGAFSACTLHGCVEAEGLPLDIPAGGTSPIRITVRTTTPGEFAGGLTFYTTCADEAEVVLKVIGRVVEG